MESKLIRTLQSRKFWAAVIGLILILVTTRNQDPFPTDAVVTAILSIVAAYIGATAWEDGKTAEMMGKMIYPEIDPDKDGE